MTRTRTTTRRRKLACPRWRADDELDAGYDTTLLLTALLLVLSAILAGLILHQSRSALVGLGPVQHSEPALLPPLTPTPGRLVEDVPAHRQ